MCKKPLNLKLNVKIHLMFSHFLVPFTKAHNIKTTDYCYNSVICITLVLARSDLIQRLLLYLGSLTPNKGDIVKNKGSNT